MYYVVDTATKETVVNRSLTTDTEALTEAKRYAAGKAHSKIAVCKVVAYIRSETTVLTEDVD